MRFSSATLLPLGLVAVRALPLTSTTNVEPTGCRVDLTPTLSEPQNAASNIIISIMKKWTTTTSTSYFSSDYLDAQNTVHAPFFVIFKAGVIPDFLSIDQLAPVLNAWVGTYLIGGASPVQDDYAITAVTCA